MRRLIPIRNSVVCKRINNKSDLQTIGLIQVRRQNVDLYEIIDISTDEPSDFSIGDVIMSCSTGDEIEINDNETVYIFKTDNIMCKVN